jgi:hypothetical protein
MARRASFVLVVAFVAGFAAACAGDGSEARQSDVPPRQVVHSPAVPDPAGAARVVKQWLVTVQDKDLKAACPFMTPDFQRQTPAYNCGNPNADDSPPFLTVDYRVADVRVRSQDGDSAIVEVTFPDGQGPPTTYSALYDPRKSRWLVAGRDAEQN